MRFRSLVQIVVKHPDEQSERSSGTPRIFHPITTDDYRVLTSCLQLYLVQTPGPAQAYVCQRRIWNADRMILRLKDQGIIIELYTNAFLT